ncbi:hypothetical protein P9858_25160 [Niallia circulans]|uniref:hypothetical protein n=1 Tax=Niallia circulans TaxID=1397 RepID=UPI002E1B6D81|nr:hypothetical protein [Niallia circulans]
MNPFNLFDINRNDFNFMMDMNGKLIFVNGEPKRALISNTRNLKDYNDKYISTDYNMSRGDIVFYDSMYWMLTTQVGTPRYESYKALMRQAEHDIIFNLSFVSSPPQKYLLKCPAIVQQSSDFGAEYSRSTETITVYSEIHVFVQDNAKTRNIIELANDADGRIVFGRRSFEITGVSTANKGVLDITCTLTTKAPTDDYDNSIYNPPANFEQYIDDSMYQLQDGSGGGSGTLQLPDASVVTNVGTINVTLAFNSYDVTWDIEANKDNYLGFAGYRVRVYTKMIFGEGSMLEEQTVVTEYANIGQHQGGDNGLSVTIESIFTDGTTTVYTQPQKKYYS